MNFAIANARVFKKCFFATLRSTLFFSAKFYSNSAKKKFRFLRVIVIDVELPFISGLGT